MDREQKGREETHKTKTSYESVANMIDKHIKASNDIINNLIKTRYPISKTTRTLEISKALNFMIGENFKLSYQILIMFDGLRERLENVEHIVQILAEQSDADLSSIKTDLASLKKQQLPKEARKYINEFRQEWEEFKQKSQKWFVGAH